MRQVNLSTDVFAKIWSMRESGEETEDQILRRVLAIQEGVCVPPANSSAGRGYRDPRSGVELPAGFEIFRRYKGKEFKARATGGGWTLINDNRFYPSLNALSQKVTDGNENAWVNWNYVSDDGEIRKVSELRDDSVIAKRAKPVAGLSTINDGDGSDLVWRDDVAKALTNLGGRAHLAEIYSEVREIRRHRGASLPKSLEAIVRKELEYNSSDTESFLGKYDLFCSVAGLGEGVWELRGYIATT